MPETTYEPYPNRWATSAAARLIGSGIRLHVHNIERIALIFQKAHDEAEAEKARATEAYQRELGETKRKLGVLRENGTRSSGRKS